MASSIAHLTHPQHAFEQIAERRKPEHPAAPELGQLLCRHHHAAEADHKQEEKRDQQTGQQLVGRKRCDRLAETHVIEFKEQDAQVQKSRGEARGGRAKADQAKPPTAVIHAAGSERVRDLDQHGTCRPGDPAVDFGIVLARLEDVAGIEEDGLKLLDQRRRDGQGHEHREKTGLEVDGRVTKVVECEGREEPRQDVQHELSHDVIRGALRRDQHDISNRTTISLTQ